MTKTTTHLMSALKASHLKMLKLAQAGPVLTNDPFNPAKLTPLRSLPTKGAVAKSIITSLQRRGLLDSNGNLTPAGRGVLVKNPHSHEETSS